ncbi:alpha/beta fold hydrolase [Haloglomus litoreum]|uniref:alpha/beta fold hydrolase n=1 Tax=Haloglomus litoreum TaxID=3034026 RepID=UPI0023E81BBD|nr:alpha/beta fold hydrolase [Haloglomus sp. DT116]
MTLRSRGTDVHAESPFASLYRRARTDLLSVPVTDREVETTDGSTHLLTAGDPDASPLLLLQGANVTNPVTLSWVQSLSDEYYLVAPDTPGEPAELETEAPADFGRWVASLLDGLGLERVPAVGISHGGGVLLEAAATIPERVSAAGFVVPAGFGVSPSAALARVVGLSLAYRLVPRERLLEAALAPLFTTPVADLPPVVRETVALALRTADVKTGFPGPDRAEALAEFDAPTLLVGGERDPFFPAGWLHEQSVPYLPEGTERAYSSSRRRSTSARSTSSRTADERAEGWYTIQHSF